MEYVNSKFLLNRRQLITSAAAMATVPAFAQKARANTPKRGGHLKLGLDGASSTHSLDPVTWSSTWPTAVAFQIFNTLLEVDENGGLLPSLAEEWSSDPTASIWTFKLRKGVTFNNGKTLTAADVIYSIDYHRGPNATSGAKPLLEQIASIEAPNPSEIVVKLQGPNADFAYILSDFRVVITMAGAPHTDAIGTGAFILESYQPGVRVLTKRNPNYWNAANRGWVDSVETVAVNDPTSRVNALQSGEIHIANRIDPKAIGLLEGAGTTQIFSYSGTPHYVFAMRCDIAPFDNLDLRLAMKYGINRQQLVDSILFGHGAVGNDNPIPSMNPFFAESIPQRKYDPDKAKFHFKKSGHTGPLQISSSDAAFAGAVDAALIFQSNLKEAGIDIEVISEPADSYWDKVWQQKPFSAAFWWGRPTADAMLSMAYKSDAPWNETLWKRPEFDKLLIAGRAELDPAKRKQIYHQCQEMIVNDGGALIPMFNNYIDGCHTSIKGYSPSPFQELSAMRAPEKIWIES